MRKLAAVESARAVMTEGMEWSIWKWLLEKKRVRGIADEARVALDDFEMKIKATWSDELKVAYNQLVSQNRDANPARQNAKLKKKEEEEEEEPKIDSRVMAAVKRVKEADDEAYNAHEDAEDIFAEGEKRMSASMAREGARKALEAYDLHDAAIRKAEALARIK